MLGDGIPLDNFLTAEDFKLGADQSDIAAQYYYGCDFHGGSAVLMTQPLTDHYRRIMDEFPILSRLQSV
jgi:hypothetical protein